MDRHRIDACAEWIAHFPPMMQAVSAWRPERFQIPHDAKEKESIKKDCVFSSSIEVIDIAKLKFGKYQHYKGGEYDVLDVAQHSESQEDMVIYRALTDGSLFARPKSTFLEKVKKGKTSVPRFSFVG